MTLAGDNRGLAAGRAAAGRGGSVLILALWTLFFLAALAVAVGARVGSALRLAEALSVEERGYLLAKAGVETVIGDLAADTNGWDALTEFWRTDEARFRDVPLSGGFFNVRCAVRDRAGWAEWTYGLADEESRVHLNEADTNLLAALFRVAGRLSRGEAAEVAEAIARYGDQKKQRLAKEDRRLTETGNAGYAPPQDRAVARFEIVPELLLVAGMTPELYARVAPFCTVYGLGKVNINTAPAAVLQALIEAGGVAGDETDAAALAEAVAAWREAGRNFELRGGGMADLRAAARATPGAEQVDAALARMRGADIGVRSSCFRGTVWARLEGRATDAARVEFVYDREKNAHVFWYRY
mgnify:CR=1 FL=1